MGPCTALLLALLFVSPFAACAGDGPSSGPGGGGGVDAAGNPGLVVGHDAGHDAGWRPDTAAPDSVAPSDATAHDVAASDLSHGDAAASGDHSAVVFSEAARRAACANRLVARGVPGDISRPSQHER